MSEPAGDQLEDAYRQCRKLNARHGKTFYLATGLLPKPARRHVHALYGFARYADDLVDQPGVSAPDRRLAELATELDQGLAGGPVTSPVVRAACHTVAEYQIRHSYLTDFLASMAADLTVTRYPTFADLRAYMWGSASVIGLQLLPILGVDGDLRQAEQYASELGVAFQLTNFLRDVGEDYRRGRIYLPLDSMAEHGVTEAMLDGPVAAPALQALLAAEVERARGCYRRAEPGIELLAPTARDCVRTAFTLYGEILDQIERSDYQVLAHRARVGLHRRLRVGLVGYRRAVRARH